MKNQYFSILIVGLVAMGMVSVLPAQAKSECLVNGFFNGGKQPVNYYPNPFNDELTIEWDATAIKSIGIYNILGVKVIEVPLNESHSANINTSELGTGIYFLQLESESGHQTYRLVK